MWTSAHLLRTLSDSSRRSPSGSLPRWWWYSRCPSLSGGHGRRRTECVSAPPGWFSACRTAGRQRWQEVVSSFTVPLTSSWCHVTTLNICQHYPYHKCVCACAAHILWVQHTHLMERVWHLLIYTAKYKVHLTGQKKKVCFFNFAFSSRFSVSIEILTQHVFKWGSEVLQWFWVWKVMCNPSLVILKVIKMFLGTSPVLFHTVHVVSANKTFCQNKMQPSSVSVVAQPGGRWLSLQQPSMHVPDRCFSWSAAAMDKNNPVGPEKIHWK